MTTGLKPKQRLRVPKKKALSPAALLGKYAHVPTSSDAFAKAKSRDVAAEGRQR